MPALTKATRGNVKEDNKNVALVLEQSLREEEKNKEQAVRICQEEERSLAEALRLSLEEVSGDKNSPSVVPTGFFDRPDNYVMLDGKRTLCSASFLPYNPRAPSPFQPWLLTPQGLKPVKLITLGPMNASTSTLEKSPKPSLNWGQGLLTKSPQQPNLSLPSPVVPTEQPVELSNSTEKITDETNTEVPSVLPQCDEPPGEVMERNVVSTPNVEDGALNSSTNSVEQIACVEESNSSSGTTDGMGESSVFDGALRPSGSETNSLRCSSENEVAEISNSAEVGERNPCDDDDWNYDVRKVCGMNEPDIKLDGSGSSSSAQTSRSSNNTASSSDSARPMLISQAAITKLFLESRSWVDEENVVHSMKAAGLSDSSGARVRPVAILPKTLAGLLFKSKGTFYDREQLALARIKNEQDAEENYNKRLGKLFVDHSRKVKLAEQELTAKLKKVDELTENLEKRLEASRILDEENVEFNKHQSDLAQQNENLRRDVLRLKDKLRAISNGTLELNNSNVMSPPGHDSSHSSHSFASSLQSLSVNDGKKRDRSPNAQLRVSREDGLKKPRSQRELIDDWNKEGMRAVYDCCESTRDHMKTQMPIVLEGWRTKLEQALEDFRAHFEMESRDADTMQTIQEKNNFSHVSFAHLQKEFSIPTVEEGRTVSLHFYYGQLVGVINNVLTSRKTFLPNLRDADKLEAFVKYKRAVNPHCPYVARYLDAQDTIRDIERDSRRLHDSFMQRIQAMQGPNTPPDAWIHHDDYVELQALGRKPSRVALGHVIGRTKDQYYNYHECKARHIVIDFYSDARTHHRKSLIEQPFKHGGRPQWHR